MDGSLLPLPPRTGGRGVKRRRVEARDGGDDGGSAVDGDGASSTAGLPPFIPRYSLQERYEYLDHTADVQIHSWGDTLADAMANSAMGMFGYMTEPEDVKVDPTCTRVVEATGHDMISFMFNFLDACLYAFASDYFLVHDMVVVSCTAPGVTTAAMPTTPTQVACATPSTATAATGAGAAGFHIKAVCYGERFSFAKHRQGTEVKAITYSNMQVFTPTRTYTANADEGGGVGAEVGGGDRDGSKGVGMHGTAEHGDAGGAGSGGGLKRMGAYDIYVIVDI